MPGVVLGAWHECERHGGAGELLELGDDAGVCSPMPSDSGTADVGAHEAGGDAVDPYPRRQLVGQLADQTDDGMLRGGVDGSANPGVPVTTSMR